MTELILAHGGRVLEGFTGDVPVIHEDAAVAIRDGRVVEIGSYETLAAAHPRAPVIGNAQSAIIPGLVNAHHHVGLTPLQLGSPDHPLELWFASRLGLRSVDPYFDTLYSAFEMIASGVTTVQHLHPRAAGGLAGLERTADSVLRAYGDIGMRVSYSMALRDQNRLVYAPDAEFIDRLPASLGAEMASYFDAYTVPFDEQIGHFESLLGVHGDKRCIRIQLAPSNLHWLSDSALAAIAETAETHDACLHTHLLETRYQKAYAFQRGGGSALAHFQRFGLLGPRLTIGHGVWMTEEDIALCADAGITLCHNCSSNLRLKSGIAPVNRFLAKNIPVAIGIDEAGINDDRDMLQEMRLVLRMHREPGIDAPHPQATQVLRMATEHGASTTPFAGTIGRLSPGMEADLVVFDWRDITYPYQDDDIPFVDVLVQRARPSAIRTVMVAGEVIYEDGEFTLVDQAAVLAELAERLAMPPTPEEKRMRELSKAVFPYVETFYREFDLPDIELPFYRHNDRY
jgi:cytosine/adenosine deaminase-related metal-dependent hydrolase